MSQTKAVLRQELRTRGMNSHPDRSPGSVPAGWEKPRFHPKISRWKPYLPFSHRLQYFRSRRMQSRRKRRVLQAHPRGLLHQPCPGERGGCVWTLQPLQGEPTAAADRQGPAPLPSPAGIGSAGKRVTVKELFKPLCFM